MNDFPGFMKRQRNIVPENQQNTFDIKGCYYTAEDGSQMAFGLAFKTEYQKNISMIMTNT